MGFFNIKEFNDFWDAMVSLNQKFLFYKGKSITISGEHITTGYTPYPDRLNAFYERNLDKLATLTNPLITVDTRTWKSRDVYTRADFNHMVAQFNRIKDNLEGEVSHTLYCGAFKASSDRTFQTLGRGN